MTKQRFLGSFIGSLAAIAVSVAIAPMLVGAETGSSASEDIVAKPTDSPLVRQAKLSRTWTVYREKESTQIWAITNENTKREVQTMAFFTAFDANYLVKIVAAGRLSDIPTGDAITSTTGLDPAAFRKAPFACRLMKTAEKATVYLSCHGEKRPVMREGVFHQFGWEFRDVETVNASELGALEEAAAVTEETVFEEDVEVETTENRELTEQVKTRLELRGKKITRDRLIKSPSDARVFLLDKNGVRHHIKDMAAVRRHGLSLKDVTEISPDELEAIPEGSEVTETSSQAELAQ